MKRLSLFAILIICSTASFGQVPRQDSGNAKECNARARGYWDAPPQFWEKFWKECPPEQVATLNGEPVYATRGDLRPTLEKGGVPPLGADSRKASAEVTLVVVISKDGRITDGSVIQSCGEKALDDKALATVREWRFKPATRDGKPVAVKQNLIVRFDKK